MSDSLPDAIPAATLIVLRDCDDAPPDVLIVERARAMAFAGGALVFPGGRIDAADHLLADRFGGGIERAARIAAIRETVEETGIAIGIEPSPDAALLEPLRTALHEGVSFVTLIDNMGLALDLDALAPFARWRPAHPGMRIFDTHFFLAAAPRGAAAPTADAGETVKAFWASAQQVLDAADAGRARIIFPTRRNLERIALFDDFATAVAHAQAHPIRVITPWTEQRDGRPHLCIDDDLGYPVTAEPLAGTARG
jgi:8-oxo-dGTP pyrophosphatase MutT (NUDIX family)